MTTGKTIALTRWTFVDKVMSLLFNMLSRLVIISLPRSKADFIFWGSKITANGDCSHEIKRCLLLGRKVMTNLDSSSLYMHINIAAVTKLMVQQAGQEKALGAHLQLFPIRNYRLN